MNASGVSDFEPQGLVVAYHEALRRDPGPALAAAARVRAGYAERGVDLMPWSGWPLRPFFIERRKLDFIAQSVQQQLARLRSLMATQAADPARLAARLGLPAGFVAAVALPEVLRSRTFLGLMRPDGFLFQDRFVLTELNVGNGAYVSNAYTEALAAQVAADPVLGALGLDARAAARPFVAWIELLRRRLGRPRARRRLALLTPEREWRQVLSWEKRVADHVAEGIRLLAEAGIDAEVVLAADLELGEHGWPQRRGDLAPFHAVAFITVGASLLEAEGAAIEPFTRLRLGRAPLLKPLAALLFEKGCLPWLSALGPGPLAAPDGFRFEVAATEFPDPGRAVAYRTRQDEWVMKRAYSGKNTQVGVAQPGRAWQRALAWGLGGQAYVMQRYQALPQTVVPVTTDGRSIAWVQVSVELSPFIVDGRYAGALVRYAPSSPGIVLSPPPPGLGLGAVLAV